MNRENDPSQSIEALKVATLALTTKLGKKLAEFDGGAKHDPDSQLDEHTASILGRAAQPPGEAVAGAKAEGWLYAYRRLIRKRTRV